ncbi:MAG: hypothetical protein ACC656_01505 [Candidatus Heimdallarchaeota archaeon]
MSIKKDLGEGYVNLSKMLLPYINALENKDDDLNIRGKTIEQANREQPQHLSYYDERCVELNTYVKFFDVEIARIRATLIKGMESYPRDLSDRMKEKYVDQEHAYLVVYEKYLAVKEIHGQFVSIVDAFRARGYALNNITKIRVASLEDVIL